MAIKTVRIYATDQDNAPLVGVLVRVFDATGTTFITQGYTALVDGKSVVEFDLEGGDPPVNYTIRLSKTGVAFDGSLGDSSKSPQLISIYSRSENSPPLSPPLPANDFVVRGETFPLPAAVDPRLCRATGYFRDSSGKPIVGLHISLINQFKPAIVDGYAVLGERLNLQTDSAGRISVDLYRNGVYRAHIESVQATDTNTAGAIIFIRDVRVPDRPYANLVDLLFPVVSKVEWPESSISVSVGQIIEVVPTISCSDGRVLSGCAIEDVIYSVADEEVAHVQALSDKLVIMGVSVGSTQLYVTRMDQTIVTFPTTQILGSPITINVS